MDTISAKVKNQRTGPDLTETDIQNKIPSKLTKRIVMSQLNGIYYPIGLLVPLTIKGKIFMRNLWVKEFDWDTYVLSRRVNGRLLQGNASGFTFKVSKINQANKCK